MRRYWLEGWWCHLTSAELVGYSLREMRDDPAAGGRQSRTIGALCIVQCIAVDGVRIRGYGCAVVLTDEVTLLLPDAERELRRSGPQEQERHQRRGGAGHLPDADGILHLGRARKS